MCSAVAQERIEPAIAIACDLLNHVSQFSSNLMACVINIGVHNVQGVGMSAMCAAEIEAVECKPRVSSC